ncbi:hypothetical protein BLOT_001608, partial [Blomia tropicalis]
GTHILHAGPSCIIQPSRNLGSLSGTQVSHHHNHNHHHHHSYQLQHHLKHHRGICYSSLLCKQKGGVAIGKCGLGNACCIFPQSCNSISVRNSTYFTNVEYPTSTLSNRTSECSLTIHRMPGIHPICQLRLDIIEYEIEGLVVVTKRSTNKTIKETENHVNAIDYDDNCASDRITLRAMHTEEDIVPPICARKIGQHVTIDVRRHIGPFILTVQPNGDDHDQLNSRRRWNILVNQIECTRTLGSNSGTMALIKRNLKHS